MKRITRRSILAAAPGAVAFAALPARAEKKYGPGVTDTEIKIGNTGPYSGPASSYGTIPKSMAAFYRMINDQGGVNGRKINFISYDDAYSPPKTVEQVRKLVEQDGVLLIASPLGTPTNSAIWHYMNQKKVPQLFVATGATKWDDPKHYPWTIGWQPNYQSEGRVYAAYIMEHKPDGKIGVLYQNDDFGKDYLKGVKDGLGDKAKSMVAVEAAYETTDPTVDSQIIGMKAAGCDVFVNTGIPKFAAQAIRKAAEIELEAAAHSEQHRQFGRGHAEAGGSGKRQGSDYGFLSEGPDRSAVEGRSGLQGLDRFHGQILSGGRQERRRQRLRPVRLADRGAGIEAMRRRSDARERHEAGGKPARLHACRCCCRGSRSIQARPTSRRSSRSRWPASTASDGSCSAR